jgi:hypothetical protein
MPQVAAGELDGPRWITCQQLAEVHGSTIGTTLERQGLLLPTVEKFGGAPVVAFESTSRGSSGRRWLAVLAGFAVLIAVIVVRRGSGGPPVESRPTVSAAQTSSATAPHSTPSPATVPATTLSTPAVGDLGADTGAPPSMASSSPWVATDSQVSSPLTATIPRGVLPGATGWELLGYGPFGVVGYHPGTGVVVVTPVPGLMSGGGLSFVMAGTTAIIRPLDLVAGYAVPAGKPATELTGLLAQGGPAIAGPDADHLWVWAATGSGPTPEFVLVDAAGRLAGKTINLPLTVQSYWPQPDGTGNLLVPGIGGTYLARPDGLQLVTTGSVLAAGPTAFLVYDCDQHATCSAWAIDRRTGKRTAIPDRAPPQPFQSSTGPISADGHYAAILETTNASDSTAARPHLINLDTGLDRTLILDVADSPNPSSILVFSPDGHYLLIASSGSPIAAVNTQTGHITRLPLPIPPVSVIVVHPTH